MKKYLLKLFTLAAILGALINTLPVQAGTGVYVNGLQLNDNQWVTASRLVGNAIPPGFYWYNPRTGAYGSFSGQGGGSGNRFWSSHYSAGNSTSDNSQGYVSVPGYGPVSYGM